MSLSNCVLVEFDVPGKPEPRGSKQAFVLYKNRATKEPVRRPDGSIVVNTTDDNPQSKAWMELVSNHARMAWRTPDGKRKPFMQEVALEVEMIFFLRRPQAHFGTGRNAGQVKDSAPARPIVTPDDDKLLRGTRDALSGIVWKDDALIVRSIIEKRYAVSHGPEDTGEGVRIRVRASQQQTATDLPLEERNRYVPPGEAAPSDDGAQASLLPA